MLQIYVVQNGDFRKLARNEDFPKYKKKASFIWFSALNPTLDEHNLLSEYLGVDAKSLMRVFEQSTPGRYHRFYDFSAFHVPVLLADPVIHAESALVILGQQTVVTIAKNLQQDALGEVEETIRNLVHLHQSVTPSIIAVRMVQEIIERNVHVIQYLVTPTRELEEKFAEIKLDTLLTEIQRLRYLHNEITQHTTIQRHLVDLMLQHVPRHLKLDEELRTLLGTAQAELERQEQTLELNARGLTDLVALHSVILTNRLNRIIVILTAITFTVTVPSLVANIFGMYALFSLAPVFYLFGTIPLYAWQIELFVLIPAIVVPFIWVIRKGWIKLPSIT